MEITKTERKSELVVSSFVLHETGLQPIENPTFEQWLDCGAFLRKANKSLYFWIGDWLNYGHTRWGEKYLEAVDRTGYDIGTLRNYKWVASRIPNDLRVEGLGFRHYQAVADSDIEYEEQKKLLQEAQSKRMSVNDFEKYVKQRNSPLPPPSQSHQEPIKQHHLSYGMTNTEVGTVETDEDVEQPNTVPDTLHEPRQQILSSKELLLRRIEQFEGSPDDIAWLYDEISDLITRLSRIVHENSKSASA